MSAAYPRERFVGEGLRVDAYAVYARIFGDFQLFFGEGIGPAGLYGEFGRADIEGVDCGIYALELLSKRGLLSGGGVAVYERDRAFEGEAEGLEKFDERRYGRTYLTFFSPRGGERS